MQKFLSDEFLDMHIVGFEKQKAFEAGHEKLSVRIKLTQEYGGNYHDDLTSHGKDFAVGSIKERHEKARLEHRFVMEQLRDIGSNVGIDHSNFVGALGDLGRYEITAEYGNMNTVIETLRSNLNVTVNFLNPALERVLALES